MNDNSSKNSDFLSTDSEKKFGAHSEETYLLNLIPENNNSPLSEGNRKILAHHLENSHYKIYFCFLFLNSSVLWAYCSCLSAQAYYETRFPSVQFEFLTTLIFSWPMVFGHILQITFGIDKRIGISKRVFIGYCIFIFAGIIIIIQDFMPSSNSNNVGAIIVLTCIALIGFTNSLTESCLYGIAALFPHEYYTNAIQIGNGLSQVINILLNTLIRLSVGGIHQTNASERVSFYIFFAILIIVCFLAMFIYYKLINLPIVKYYMESNNMATKSTGSHQQNPIERVTELFRIWKIIILPATTQFLIFLGFLSFLFSPFFLLFDYHLSILYFMAILF